MGSASISANAKGEVVLTGGIDDELTDKDAEGEPDAEIEFDSDFNDVKQEWDDLHHVVVARVEGVIVSSFDDSDVCDILEPAGQ